jgi:hypothetical protein
MHFYDGVMLFVVLLSRGYTAPLSTVQHLLDHMQSILEL